MSETEFQPAKKRCSACGETKPLTEFARDNTRNSWQSQCKACRKERYHATKPKPQPRERKGAERTGILETWPRDENGRLLNYWHLED